MRLAVEIISISSDSCVLYLPVVLSRFFWSNLMLTRALLLMIWLVFSQWPHVAGFVVPTDGRYNLICWPCPYYMWSEILVYSYYPSIYYVYSVKFCIFCTHPPNLPGNSLSLSIMRPICNSKRGEIKELLVKGYSSRQIEDKTGVSRTTINNLRNNLPDAINKSKGGAPKKLSTRDKNYIVQLSTQPLLKSCWKLNTWEE